MKKIITSIIAILIIPFTGLNAQSISEHNGSLIQHNGEFLEGDFETFYTNGTTHETFQILNGKQHGEYISYSINGKLT